MIDINKTYKTKDGCRVTGLHIVPFNACGKKVTYPIKGTIVLREKPIKTKYMIWSEEGVVDVVWGNNNHWDLVEC